MSNTLWGQTFARSLSRYCGHGADFDWKGPLHWPIDVRDQLGPNDVRIFFRQAFSDCAVASFAVRVVTWDDISAIVFVNSATDVLSDFVAVTIFASAIVWS